MTYHLELTPTARKELSKLDRRMQQRIAAAIDDLAENPRPQGGIKLTGMENHYRIRVGDYRIIYQIHDARLLVLVVRIGNRGDVYR